MPTRIAARYMFVSGTAALVYEVLWVRDLAYVFGGSAQALSAVVAAFLAGLALGAWIAGRRVRPDPRLLKTYAWLELAIAVTAPLVPWLVVALDRAVLDPLWPAIAARGPAATSAARFLAAFVVMLPATACMGATLPVLCSAFARPGEPTGAIIGRLYGWNTLGGVMGCLLAGFVLVEHVGLWKSRLIAAALNVGLAVVAARRVARMGGASFVPGGETPREAEPTPKSVPRPVSEPIPEPEPAGRSRLARPVWAFALFVSSGLSIALELAWTRLVALGVGGTTYAFSIVLAIYLAGLGAGALVVGFAARRGASALALLVSAQIALAVLLLGVHAGVDDVMRSVGLAVFDASNRAGSSPLYVRGGLGLLLSAFLAFVPALLLGVAFPVFADLGVRSRDSIGRGVGLAYLVSTAGGVTASLATTFALLPEFGIEKTLLGAAAASGLLGALLMLALGARRILAFGGAALAAALIVALLFFARDRGHWDAKSIYGGVGLYGWRAIAPERNLVSARDGPSCSVAVFETRVERSLAVNGKVDASTKGDMSTQLLLAWLPQLMHEDPKEVFVLGYGAGVTASAAARYGARVQCAEIEPAVLAASEWFASANGNAHADPRIELVVDDGRSLLRRGRRDFDVVTTEPSNPWLAGMANLFTVEFYELCRARLGADGVLCQWVQLYWSSIEDYHAIFATLGSVFPNVAIWRTMSGDTLMLGSRAPVAFDAKTLARRVQERPWLAAALGGAPSGSLVGELARLVVLDGADARAYADAGPRRIRDDVPFLEFTAARRMQASSGSAIASSIFARRTVPLYGRRELESLLSPPELARLMLDAAAEQVMYGAPGLAEPMLQELAQKAPNLDHLPFWLWLSARRRGDEKAAAERLARLEQTTPSLLVQVAAEHLRSGEHDLAAAALDRAERKAGMSADGEYQRGQLFEQRGDRIAAAARYERALRLDPEHAPSQEAIRRLRESR